jgi:hypothetical protein
MLALSATDGRIKWGFQYTPNDPAMPFVFSLQARKFQINRLPRPSGTGAGEK